MMYFRARRMRKVLGGGMRQAGVIAAPAIIALDEIVPALIGDHRRLRFLAEGIHCTHVCKHIKEN